MAVLDKLYAELRGKPAPAPAAADPFTEHAGNFGGALTIGVDVPDAPPPPEGRRIRGYMVHTVGEARIPAAYYADTPAGAVRLLLLHGVGKHNLYALANSDRSELLSAVCVYDLTARRWSAWSVL